ncbi:MAG: hypothetical protein WAT16_03975, partial [Saprospiraceae bacterium]
RGNATNARIKDELRGNATNARIKDELINFILSISLLQFVFHSCIRGISSFLNSFSIRAFVAIKN